MSGVEAKAESETERLQKLHVSEVSTVCQDESSERQQSGGDEAQVMAVGRWKEADMGNLLEGHY